MKFKITLSVLALVFLSLGALQEPAQAKGPDPAQAEEIRKQIKEARFFKSLLAAKATINSLGGDRCGRWIQTARQLRRALKDLNEQYKGRYDATYQKKFQALKKQNSRAFKDYENCFAANLRQYPDITQQSIHAYPAFRARLKRYDKKFEKVANLDRHIAELEDALKRAKQGDVVGTLTAVRGWVRIFPLHSKIMKSKDKNFWEFVGAGRISDDQYNALISGHKFRINDRLRTGGIGSARITFSSEYANGGTAVMHVGPNTELVLGKHGAYTNDLTPKTPVIDLIKGTVRALFRPFGKKKDGGFRITTSGAIASAGRSGGTSLVLRGTEGSLTFDPKTGVSKAYLSHGDAYLESGGRRVRLAPGTTRTITAGRIGAPTPMAKSQWNRIVAGTATATGPNKPRTRSRPNQRQVATRLPANTSTLATMTRHYAKSVVENLLFALRVNDEKVLFANTGGNFHSTYRKKLSNQSLKSVLDKSGDRAMSHRFRCTYCDAAKGYCEVLVYVQRAGDRPKVLTPMIFALNTDRRDLKLRSHSVQLGRGNNLKKFMARRPVCEKQ